MNYQQFHSNLKQFAVFSLVDIRKTDPEFDNRRLVEWQQKGYIKKLRRGYYTFSDAQITQESLFGIANALYSPSYVSLESALSFHGLIPEGVYQLTSVSSRKTALFSTPLGQFSYQTVKPTLLFGYELKRIGDKTYKIASIEKAVLDYLYLHPAIVKSSDFSEWRINGQEFLAHADTKLYREYAKAFANEQLDQQAQILLRLIEAGT